MGHDGVASGYSTPTGFRRLTGCQRDPWDRGVIESHIISWPVGFHSRNYMFLLGM